jgi:hypothetical protein
VIRLSVSCNLRRATALRCAVLVQLWNDALRIECREHLRRLELARWWNDGCM